MPVLRITNGAVAGRILTLQRRILTIGGSLANDHQFPDPSVSGTHCEVALDGVGNLKVRDRGSMEGTFVDGQKVSEALMKPGQVLKLGKIELNFENNSPAVLPPPAAPTAPEPAREREPAPSIVV